MMASGLGATGWTGLVCLAASFFRLTLLFSNISCMDACFWNTFSTWSCYTHTHTQTGTERETERRKRER